MRESCSAVKNMRKCTLHCFDPSIINQEKVCHSLSGVFDCCPGFSTESVEYPVLFKQGNKRASSLKKRNKGIINASN